MITPKQRRKEFYKNLPPNTIIKNPMVVYYGSGPNGKRCKTCSSLIKKEHSKNYYKCKHRGDTNSPNTDHRVNWEACSLYE